MKKGFIYPGSIFDKFECFMEGELVTIVAEPNSGKTTFAMDILDRNSSIGRKCFYINLEFNVKTVWQERWLYTNGYTKQSLTDLNYMGEDKEKEMNEYVETQLKKFEYFNRPSGISLKDLTDLISLKSMEGFDLFVVDTFSRITGNLEKDSRSNQNKCMEALQELVQRLGIAVVLLHHTNKDGKFEGSQKILDLSNVFITITKSDADGAIPEHRIFELTKDKFISKTELEVWYKNGLYYDHTA